MTTTTATKGTKAVGGVARNPHPGTYGTVGAHDAAGAYGTAGAYGPPHGAYGGAYAPHGSDASVGRGARFARQVGYLLSGMPIGIVAFVLMVTGFCLGTPTLILLLGLPVLAGTLAVARYFGRLEASWIAQATGRPLPPEPERPRRGGWGLLADAQGWRDLLHAVVAFPVRVASFGITLVWLVGAMGGITYGLWVWTLPQGDTQGWVELAFGWTGTAADIAGNAVVGVFCLLTVVPLVRGLTACQAGLGRVLLRGGTL